jgi:hypothetical protein
LARGILRYCADPEPLVTAWLAEEQRAEAARTGSRAVRTTERQRAYDLEDVPCPGLAARARGRHVRHAQHLKTDQRAIYRKLGAQSREEAVIRACEGGLI